MSSSDSESSPFNVCLESERVKLVPFDLSKHVPYLMGAPDSLYDFIGIGPWPDAAHFKDDFYDPIVKAGGQSAFLYAVFDTTRSEHEDASSFAGMIGYIDTSFVDLATEIGPIVILPDFQRTHVTSNAMGLLLQFALNSPSDAKSGLGFRRMVWKASSVNVKSIAAAKRMGFQYEGTLRWHRVLSQADAKQWNGKAIKEGDVKSPSLGRDTVILSVCWDDWAERVKTLTEENMARR
ncbi:hypothetical protein BDZ89DRAFT_991266 [Hymenopellis radicata]|nr:hypothetical protein BDZ89DRAFT_991266 [Hymenopellis radicata]